MTPQDPQSPLNNAPADGASQPANLDAQIPPTYSAAPAPTAPAASGGSALQDALNAQLATPATPASPAAAPVANPADAAVDAHMAAENPDPMAGFTDPDVQAAPVAAPLAGDGQAMPGQAVAPTPTMPDPALPVTPDQPVSPATPVVPDAAANAMPAPAATQAYDPSQDTGVGAPATSYPAAPEPLPPNPLEMDASAVPAAPVAAEMPIAQPEPVAAPVAPEPAPMPTAPVTPEAMPAPAVEQPAIDPVTGAPLAPGADGQLSQTQPAADPTLQSMLDDSSSAQAASIDPYNDPALMAAAPASSGKGGKGILMAVGIGAAVLIFGIVILALILGRKPVTEVPADSLTGEQQQTDSANLEATITVPDGYVAVVKSCFEFALPTDNTVTTDDSACKVDATFGSQGVSTIAVLPSITKFDSLDKAVVASKEANKITTANTVSERKITLGGFDAQEVVFNAGTAEAPQNKTMLVVVLKDSKYKLDGDTITSFEINMSSNDEFTKNAVSTLESTWSWK